MASSPQRNHAFIYDRKVASHYNRSYDNVAHNSHAILPLVLLLFMVEADLGKIMLCLMFLGECAKNLQLFIMLAILRLFFHVKMQK
jgi:hypothetical protein